MLSNVVTPEHIKTYKENGAVFLPGVISQTWLDLIEIGLERNLRCPGPFGVEIKNKGTGRFFTDHYNFFVNPEFQRLLYDSPIVDILGDIMESEEVFLFYDQVFFKGGGTADRTAFHQDMPYYQMMDSPQIAGAWISLDPLDAEHALEYVAGSHLGPEYNTFDLNNPSKVGVDNGQPPVPNIQKERDKWDIRSHACKPGDMLVIHPKVLHGGAPVSEGMQRRTMTVNVFGSEVRYQPKPTGLGMRYPGIEEALKPGDLLRHPYFPRLRPLPAEEMRVGRAA
jgi:ectoine hydroxylase-related dioxygenase (phytanoyl-CoA dioxygenase family)